jgi:hypothetical protein
MMDQPAANYLEDVGLAQEAYARTLARYAAVAPAVVHVRVMGMLAAMHEAVAEAAPEVADDIAQAYSYFDGRCVARRRAAR